MTDNANPDRENENVSRDREIADLKKQITILKRDRRGETSQGSSDDDKPKNGGRAQRGPNNNTPASQEDMRNFIQTAMETLQGFATQLNLQTNTGVTHSNK